MNSKHIPLLLSILAAVTLNSKAMAEAPKVEFPAASPTCTLKQRVGLTDVEVVYSRPSVKDRAIFGAMVPYGKVWRTGANQATKVTFSTDVKLNGKDVPAGTYALLTIPGKDEWTVIVNKGPEGWSPYKYDEKQDLVRFTVKPISMPWSMETFTIDFNEIRDESAKLTMIWDKTKIPVDLTVSYADKLTQQIKDVMASSEAKKPYFQAANFYYNHNLDMNEAKKWVDEALKEREAHYIVFLKAEILERLGDKEGAVAAAKRSKELAEKANDNGYIQLNEALINKLQ
ncbi:MAG: DUF2911 domain-containing protein [Candidatus Melainabacteria bacterium]|nr:DUF2911 domain-containing protein [Candidatus Melainabacteria bacterium]